MPVTVMHMKGRVVSAQKHIVTVPWTLSKFAVQRNSLNSSLDFKFTECGEFWLKGLILARGIAKRPSLSSSDLTLSNRIQGKRM